MSINEQIADLEKPINEQIADLQKRGDRTHGVLVELLSTAADFSGDIDHRAIAEGLIAVHAQFIGLAAEAVGLIADSEITDWGLLDQVKDAAWLHLKMAELSR